MGGALEDKECSTCGEEGCVAWVPAVDRDQSPLQTVVINPVCESCLRDYLNLLNITAEVEE